MPRELGNTVWYSPDEVADIIGKHYNSALAKIKAGKIEHEYINGGYLVSHKSLVKYLDEINLPESIIEHRLSKKKVATAN